MRRLSALDVFPTLKRYPAFWPRVPDIVPIGFRLSQTKDEKAKGHAEVREATPKDYKRETHLSKGLRTLYSDLGVLAFAGCTTAQTERIGAILKEVMRWGCPTRLNQSTRSGYSPSQYKLKVGSRTLLKDGSNQNEHGVPIAGQLTAQSVASLAEKAMQNSPIKMRSSVVDHEKTTIEVLAQSARRGVYLETETGRRQLPLICHVVWDNTQSATVICKVMITTVGTGAVVGLYKTLLSRKHHDGRENPDKRLSIFEKPKVRRSAKEYEKARNAREVRLRIMDELAQLEMEIWAHRSNEPITDDYGTAFAKA